MRSVSRRLATLVCKWHCVVLCVWCVGFVDASVLAATRALDVSAAAPSATAHGPIALAPYLDALEDPGHKLTIADLRGTMAVPSAAWRAVSAPEVNYGYSKSSYWLRLHVHNTGHTPVDRMLELSHWGSSGSSFTKPRQTVRFEAW